MNSNHLQSTGSSPDWDRFNRLSTKLKSPSRGAFDTTSRITSALHYDNRDLTSGRYRIRLYRYLTEVIPIVNACIATWTRLSAAPGEYRIMGNGPVETRERALSRLAALSERIYLNASGGSGSLVTFLSELFSGLYRDGVFGGFLTVHRDFSGVDKFVPIDTLGLTVRIQNNRPKLVLEMDRGAMELERPDFYYIPFNGDRDRPLGRSVLSSVGFVTYIEQQLVDDMRRASHNSGYHRLHVKVTPPERMAGEADSAYIDRINNYFDSTVGMIRSCEVDENPVTWNNVEIDHIGPENVRSVTNSWFVNHRAMIEEISAGTNLAPFLLGYSYGATATWSSFKFDIVMRQVKSIQAQAATFLEWLGNIDLALGGFNERCRFEFDNTFAYQALDRASVESSRVDNLLKLYQSGLIDESTARLRAGELI